MADSVLTPSQQVGNLMLISSSASHTCHTRGHVSRVRCLPRHALTGRMPLVWPELCAAQPPASSRSQACGSAQVAVGRDSRASLARILRPAGKALATPVCQM